MTTDPARLPRPRRGQVDDVGRVAVPDQRGDRAERLDLVHLGAARVIGDKQDGRDERAALRVGPGDLDALRVTEDDVPGGLKRLQRPAHLFPLVEAGERAHPHGLVGRVADHDRGQPLAHRLGDGVQLPGGDEGAADRGALLPGLDGHLHHKLPDVAVERRRARARRPARAPTCSASPPRR